MAILELPPAVLETMTVGQVNAAVETKLRLLGAKVR